MSDLKPPERIWLQFNEPEVDRQVTWERDQIHDSDVEYVRAGEEEVVNWRIEWNGDGGWKEYLTVSHDPTEEYEGRLDFRVRPLTYARGGEHG